MKGTRLLLFMLLAFLESRSQNPASVFTIANRQVVLSCGTNCTSISAKIPDLKQSDDYIVSSIPYQPFAYATATGNELTSVYADDTLSANISIGFPFCFYGITYPTLLIGSNALITFDTARANTSSSFAISAVDTLPGLGYPSAAIFGPYQDINPSASNNPAPTSRKIEWRVEGTAPFRRFIASFNSVRYFGSACSTYLATHQMVLYENTGVVEIYIQDKPVCTAWNSGLSILGIQNKARNKAVTAPGKNSKQWGATGMNEAYRFTPNAGSSRFKRAELVLNGNIIAFGDTASAGNGLLNLDFPNVCPGQDSAAYVLRVVYGSCNDPAQDLSYLDTVFIKRPPLAISLTTVDASCAGSGTIKANVTGGTALQYSLNGGAAQAADSFSGLHSGDYTVTVQSGSCIASVQTTVALNNSLTVSALPSDTSICLGASFIPRVSSGAATYAWTPGSSVTNPSAMQPTLTPLQQTDFIVTAMQGECLAKDTIRTSVFKGAQIDAGPDMEILQGDKTVLQASGSAGNYLWTPPAGLSATNILNPLASPAVTTTYSLLVTTTDGCKDSDTLRLTVLPYCVKPMEAFTPNGDGINDHWLVTTGNCLKSAKAEVFNRYGSLVYRSEDYKNDWDGTYKGKALPDGTYYFVITYQLINGKTVYLKGNVTILR
jgi:gliding motility-associated-like protein